jgi:hypothetical protein
MADPDAAPAEDAQVIVPVEEGITSLDGESSGLVGQSDIAEFQISGYLLKFAALVLGTEYTPFGDRHVTEADIEWLAVMESVAGEAGVGVLGENELHDALPQSL